MFAKERQDNIYQLIKTRGAVTTSALVELFQVSIETIRRDLLEMERHGLLLRVHGGAVAVGSMKPYVELEERTQEFAEQKQLLSKLAANFVSEGDIIGIDSGSTAISFAEALKNRFSRLTIITHSLDVFHLLSDSFSVILCGGHYLREEKAFYGPLALEMLQNLHMQKTFLFPSAVSLEAGICDFHKDLYPLQRQLLKSADEIFILADNSKFEKKALYRLAPMQPEYHYITDPGIHEDLKKLYKDHKINLYTGGKIK